MILQLILSLLLVSCLSKIEENPIDEINEIEHYDSLDTGPWPMYCHDPQHTCRSEYKGLTEKPQGPKWVYKSPGGVMGFPSSIAIGSSGTIYAGTAHNEDFVNNPLKGYSGVFCAISPDGKKEWTHDSHRGSPMISMIESGPLLTSDGKIIYGKDDGHVYALDKKGKLLWDFQADDPFDQNNHNDNEQIIPSPVLGSNNTLYILSHWGNVYSDLVINAWQGNYLLNEILKAYNIKASTDEVWGKVYAVDVQTGERKWVFDPSLDSSGKKSFWGSPALDKNETLYAAAYDNSYNGYLYALNSNGTIKWRYPKDDNIKIHALQSSPSIGQDGTIYVGSYNTQVQTPGKARLYAFNSNGTLKWYYEINENRITSGPAIGSDGSLYFGSHFHPEGPARGVLYNIKDLGSQAKLQWKFETKYGILASPAVDKIGNVFFKTTTIESTQENNDTEPFFELYALNNKGEELWSYPMPGRSWGSPSIGKDGTIYISIMGRSKADKAGVYAFGP